MKIRHFLAGMLTTLWAGFWGYFAVASLLSEPGETLTRLKVAAFVAVLLGSSLWAAWTRSRAGSLWLCLVGAGLGVLNAVYFHNPLATRLFLYLTLALPPLAAGVLKACGATREHRS